MARRSTPRLLACLAVGAVCLSACSAKTEASESLPSASASPTTPTLTPLGPADMPMPAEARTQDAAGAEAFVRYYIALINRTSKVMDAKPLRDFSQGCRDCIRIASDTEKDRASGYHYQGGHIAISWIKAFKPSDTVEVSLATTQDALRVLDRSNKPVAGLSFPALFGRASGASGRWNSELTCWVLTGLTL